VDKKRGSSVGSGPSELPFAPMRGVGEGEKSISYENSKTMKLACSFAQNKSKPIANVGPFLMSQLATCISKRCSDSLQFQLHLFLKETSFSVLHFRV